MTSLARRSRMELKTFVVELCSRKHVAAVDSSLVESDSCQLVVEAVDNCLVLVADSCWVEAVDSCCNTVVDVDSWD